MSRPQFTPELKHEAVRQVIEEGPSVQEVATPVQEVAAPVHEVAASSGASSHGSYQWVKAATPEKNEQRADELLDAKKEILKLRAELRR